MFGIGGMELVLILIVALVVLGPDHLPRVMRTLGKTVGDLRRASTEFQRTMNTEIAQHELSQSDAAAKAADPTHALPLPEAPSPSPAVPDAAVPATSARRTRKAPCPRIKRPKLQEPEPEPTPPPAPEAQRKAPAFSAGPARTAARRQAAARTAARQGTSSDGNHQ